MPSGIYKHKKHSEETKKKMSKAHKGMKFSEERNKKVSQTLKTLGIKPPSRLGLKGKKSANWKGGISDTSWKRWRQKNYNRVLFLNSRRRAIKNNAEGSHTFGEWELLKKQYGYTCPACRREEPKIKLSEDHIIPLDKGGSDNIENIQPLCRSCNCKKYTKIIKYAN